MILRFNKLLAWLLLLTAITIIGEAWKYFYLKKYDLVVTPSVPMGLYEKSDEIHDYVAVEFSQDQLNRVKRVIDFFKTEHLVKIPFALAGERVCFDGEHLINDSQLVSFSTPVGKRVKQAFKMKQGCKVIDNDHVYVVSHYPESIDSRVLGEMKLVSPSGRRLVYEFDNPLKDWIEWNFNPSWLTVLYIAIDSKTLVK